MKKIFIGVGHGGLDYGAVNGEYKESEIALEIAETVCSELVRHGVNAVLSRTSQGTDAETDLPVKIAQCNSFDPDLAVDIHINAGGGKGFEAIVYHGGGTSLDMGQNIEAEVLKIGQNSRGMKTRLNSQGNDYFGWIRQVNAPSVILEAAFIDNPADLLLIKTAEGRRNFGIAYAKGLLRTIGIEYINADKKEDTMTYKTINDIPDWGKKTVEKLIEKKALSGTGSGELNMSYDMLRIMVVLDRLGKLD